MRSSVSASVVYLSFGYPTKPDPGQVGLHREPLSRGSTPEAESGGEGEVLGVGSRSGQHAELARREPGGADDLVLVEGTAEVTAVEVAGERPRRGRLLPDGRRATEARAGPGYIVGEAPPRRDEALAKEREVGQEPGRRLVRVQIPALVVGTLQAAADQGVVQQPGRADVRLAAQREDVRGAVGQLYAGSGDGGLHHRLGVVRGRMSQRLVRRRDAEGGAVVVRPVVQRGD